VTPPLRLRLHPAAAVATASATSATLKGEFGAKGKKP
jgi:hypothetical protein